MSQHPLDALTTDEYWAAHDALQRSGHLDDTLAASLLLHEPDKDKVLAWKPGDAIPHEADVILLHDGKTYEARVNIAAHQLVFWKEAPGRQAPIMQSELDAGRCGNGDCEGHQCLGAAWFTSRASRSMERWWLRIRWLSMCTLGFRHVVRLEDWPVMPVLWHDFLLRPFNFFDESPVLTLAHQP